MQDILLVLGTPQGIQELPEDHGHEGKGDPVPDSADRAQDHKDTIQGIGK